MYRVELYQRVRRACHVEGMSIREAARQFGLHRDTVRKMLMYSLKKSIAPGANILRSIGLFNLNMAIIYITIHTNINICLIRFIYMPNQDS